MTNTYVYRIEHTASRYGPFSGNGAAHMYNGARDWDNYPSCTTMPAPYEEAECWPLSSYQLRADHRFAFKHIPGLLRWFGCPKGRATMASYGFTLAIYKVPVDAVVPGEDQCVFSLTRAKHIADVSLTDDLSTVALGAISLASD